MSLCSLLHFINVYYRCNVVELDSEKLSNFAVLEALKSFSTLWLLLANTIVFETVNQHMQEEKLKITID